MKGRVSVRRSVEAQLINDVKDGNRAVSSAAMQRIIDNYQPMIGYFTNKIPPGFFTADEIQIDFETEVYHAVRTFDPSQKCKLSTHIYTYLKGMCNKLLDKAYNPQTYIHLVDDKDDSKKVVSDRFVVSPSVEQSLDEEFLVNSMPANLRPTAKCIIVDKYTQAETARHLSVSKPAVCKRLEKIRTFASLYLN